MTDPQHMKSVYDEYQQKKETRPGVSLLIFAAM